MRLFFAFIYIGLGLWVYFKIGGDELNSYVSLSFGFCLVLSSVIVCNEGFIRILKNQSDEEYLTELLGKGMAKREEFSVSRAITFEDFNTSCLCHILEIGPEKAICLYGQYLYDYVEIDDDPELNQERSFPTSEFSIVRKVKNNEIVRLYEGKHVVDEIRAINTDKTKLRNLGFKLKDGEIINNVDFDKVILACK